MFFKNKSVLVTGGAGVIGKDLIKELYAQGAFIRCVDLKEKPSCFNNLNIDYYRLDLADSRSQLLFRFNPEYVFHLAADFERSEESFEFWESNFRNNILASRNTLNKIISCSSLKKVIFASSYLIYNKNNYADMQTSNILSENMEIDPRNLTGVAKLQTERDLEFLSEFGNHSFDVVSARIFRVYGRGSRDIISRWVRSIISNEEIVVFGEDNAFDYIYSADVAKALISLAKSEKGKGIFNLGSGITTKISEVLDILKKKFPAVVINKVDKTIFDESSCADMRKFSKLFPDFSFLSIDEGISEIIEYENNKK